MDIDLNKVPKVDKGEVISKIKNIALVVMSIVILFLTKQIVVTTNSLELIKFGNTTGLRITWEFGYSLEEIKKDTKEIIEDKQELINETLKSIDVE